MAESILPSILASLLDAFQSRPFINSNTRCSPRPLLAIGTRLSPLTLVDKTEYVVYQIKCHFEES
uniref:Uncharacterized protein n=1 Tax=Oryza rufipogon TaxID=4529 RepID=A0A0E0QK22_ORYRU